VSDISSVDAEIVESRTLTEIEASIKGHLTTMVRGTLEAFEARISIGHDLLEARELLPGDTEFGRWAKELVPTATQPWRWLLMTAAANEEIVRNCLPPISQLMGDRRGINFEKLVKQALPQGTSNGRSPIPPATGTYPTIVIDPPWAYDNKATRGAASNHYETMTFEELEVLEIPAADNAHLYLWVTNGFLREGLDLLQSWGFDYKTMLTWVKPQIGLGNYFRSATEHVLFGLKGSLPTQGQDTPNWFQADRKRHSQKPEKFYDIVEKVSPAPWFEMFSRPPDRFGWTTWGDQK
jgi:N6-adenosine-specific RNA methylase IME4